MSDLTQTCPRCNQTLDQWGEHLGGCTPIARVKPKPVRAPRPKKAAPEQRTFETRGDSRAKRLVALVSEHAAAPTSAADVAFVLQISIALAGVTLCVACKAGHIKRVSRGRYFRPTGADAVAEPEHEAA